MAAVKAGAVHELSPFTGQTAGLIREVLPAAAIVRRIAEEAEDALRRAATLSNRVELPDKAKFSKEATWQLRR